MGLLRKKANTYVVFREWWESRSKFTGHAVREFIDRLFGGSAEGLVMNLLQEKHLTPEKLAELHALIEKEERDAKN